MMAQDLTFCISALRWKDLYASVLPIFNQRNKIQKLVIMTTQQKEKREKFYPLKAAELLKIKTLLTDSEVITLLYLKSLNPFGDFRDMDTAIMAEQLGINRRTAQRFLKKFEALGLIELKIKDFEYRTQAFKDDAIDSPYSRHKSGDRRGQCSEIAADGLVDSRIAETISESNLGSQDRLVDSRIAETILESNLGSQDRFRELEPSHSKDSGSSYTLKTFNTTNTTNTEAVGVKDEDLIESNIKEQSLSPIIPSKIDPDIKERLRSLSIPLSKPVISAISKNSPEFVLRTLEDIEETGEEIKSPIAVFLYRLNKPATVTTTAPEVQKKELSSEFREWYQYARGEIVEDIEPEYLARDRYDEPLVRLKNDRYNRLIEWRRAKGGEDFSVCTGEALHSILDKIRHKFQGGEKK